MGSWDVMTTKSRFNHPSRGFFYKFLEKEFGSSNFSLADIGVVSMVDYKRLRQEKPNLDFRYTGIDINKDIVEEARGHLEGSDEVVLWDIHEEHPDFIEAEGFDVILVKHMLHYCKGYEVLENLQPVVKKGGAIIVVNNRNIYTPKNKHKDNGEVLYSFGRYTTTYSEKAYKKYLRNHFGSVDHRSFAGSKTYKPYTLDILR